jgi:hypothetical protein
MSRLYIAVAVGIPSSVPNAVYSMTCLLAADQEFLACLERS